MATVILKWNPTFSSYSMFNYLYDIVNLNFDEEVDNNWSVWDYDKIDVGDRYFMVKLGAGATGIVGTGLISSEPYEAEDWSGKGRRMFYADFVPEMMLNPDALPILSTTTLASRIPGFEWDYGHSGLVLDQADGELLNKLWEAFVEEHRAEFEKKATCGRYENDYIYWLRK